MGKPALVGDEPLRIRLLGEVQVSRGEVPAPLPASKKTRALLAYLVVTGREQRRGRLCDLLWDVTDDPRGALRWSLSKLRKVVDDSSHKRLVADRESVTFVAAEVAVDRFELRDAHRRGFEGATTEQLTAVARRIGGEFLEGMELASFDNFQAWCVAEREQVRREHASLLRAIVARHRAEPERGLPYARRLVQLEPLDEPARVVLTELLLVSGRREEAEQQYESAKRLFAELGRGDPRELRQLVRGGARSVVPAMVPAPELDEPPAASVKGATIVGRRDELSWLRSRLSSVCRQRRERVVLLAGEPGVGKSRLLAELSRDAERSGAVVLIGACFEAERDRPFGPWIDALRAAPPALVSDRSDDLGPLLPQGRSEPAGELTRDRFFVAFADRIASWTDAAAERPHPSVLVVLDDVHWCDEASASLLHFVARTSRQIPLMVALAARAGELDDNAAILRVVRSLRRDGLLHDLAIGPLGPDETEALVRAVAPLHDPTQIHADSAGNPLFALELARSRLARADRPERRDGGFGLTLTQLVRDRIDRLPPAAADVLRWGAILGNHIGVARLSKLTVIDALALTSTLEELERHALLVVAEASDDPLGAYRFAHDVVRQVVYAELSAPRRRLMHQRVAALLDAGDDPRPVLPTELAHHALLGGDPSLAARACVTAGWRCLQSFAAGEAFALSKRGMTAAEQLAEPEQTERMIELMQVSYAARRPTDPDAAGKALEDLAHRALDHGRREHARRAFNVLSYVRWEVGDWTEAQRGMLQAERISRAAADEDRVSALAEAARCLLLLERDLHHAEALSLEAVALSERLGLEASMVSDSTGMLHLHRGELDAARACFATALAHARRRSEHLHELHALEHLVVVELTAEQYEPACRFANQLVTLATKFREGSEGAFSLCLKALCSQARGAPTAAEELAGALDDLRRADAKHRLSFTLNRAAQLALRAGEPEAARTQAEEALELATILQHPSEMVLARVVLARAARMLGDEQAATRAEAQLREMPLTAVAIPIRRLAEALARESGAVAPAGAA